MPHKEKRLKDAKAAAEEADFRVLQTHNGGSHDTEGFASFTLGYEPLAPLGHSTFQVVRLLSAAGGIQPERLNAEGEARVLLAGG